MADKPGAGSEVGWLVSGVWLVCVARSAARLPPFEATQTRFWPISRPTQLKSALADPK